MNRRFLQIDASDSNDKSEYDLIKKYLYYTQKQPAKKYQKTI